MLFGKTHRRRSRRSSRSGPGHPGRARSEPVRPGANRSGPEQLCHPEGQVEGLAGIQSRVAGGGVPLVELTLDNVLDTTETLGDVVTGQLHVDPAGPGALGQMRPEEALEL